MKILKKSLLMGLALFSAPLTGFAGACSTQTANNIALLNGCRIQPVIGPVVFDNFFLTINDQSNPGGLQASDLTISFDSQLRALPYDQVFAITVSGDSQWSIASGQWSFTFGYTLNTNIPCNQTYDIFQCPNLFPSGFGASETGATTTGGGASAVTMSFLGLNSDASDLNPAPPFTHIATQKFFSQSVVNTVTNNAGNGSSSLTSITNAFFIPEPTTWTMQCAGLLMLGWVIRRRKGNA